MRGFNLSQIKLNPQFKAKTYISKFFQRAKCKVELWMYLATTIHGKVSLHKISKQENKHNLK